MVLSPSIITQLKQTVTRIIELLHNVLYVLIVSVTISYVKLEDIIIIMAFNQNVQSRYNIIQV